MKARTRFAPSPTGYIHVGNVRSALYPYLIAKQTGGDFILRIEDTDQARFVEGAEDLILDTLKWLSLDWNEGPIYGEKGQESGGFGPYHQTNRRENLSRLGEEINRKRFDDKDQNHHFLGLFYHKSDLHSSLSQAILECQELNLPHL